MLYTKYAHTGHTRDEWRVSLDSDSTVYARSMLNVLICIA